MKKLLFLLSLLLLFAFSVDTDPIPIEGLWSISLVKMGAQEMTPNARWIRFQPNHTQQSGNGWYQHSNGSWQYNVQNQELTIHNSNGINDPFGPFKVTETEDGMMWTRHEGEGEVEVYLQRIQQLPQTQADQLLGLWQLDQSAGEDAFIHSAKDEAVSMYFAWDRRFILQIGKTKIHGVYHPHAHKPEVEFIPYEEIPRNYWKVQVANDSIELKRVDTDSVVLRTFIRIHEFLN